MTITVRAVYAGGVLRPVQPLALAEGETVDVTIAPGDTVAAAASATEDEVILRIQACKTYQEWLEVTKMLPADDGAYDIVQALDDNRRWSGERSLLSDERAQPRATQSVLTSVPTRSVGTRNW
jgi:predicted DNA-binding antitoxin AbrB/MazE fold protein